MSKKGCAVAASILYYVGIFMLLWEIVLRTSVGNRLVFVGFPLAAACYFVIAGTLFHRYFQISRRRLWILMNGIGYPLCWIALTIRIPGIWFNLAIAFLFLPMTVILAVVWGIVGTGFLCVGKLKRFAPAEAGKEPYLREERIRTASPLYLLLYLSGPVLIFVLFVLCFAVQPVLALVLLVAGNMLWFFLFPSCCQRIGRNRLEKMAEESGLSLEPVFQSTDWYLAADGRQGKIGLLLSRNPFHPYILSARRVTQVSVDNGNMGNGFWGGTCRVRLLLFVDDKKISLTIFSTSFHNRMGLESSTIRYSIAEAEKIREEILRLRESRI